MAHISILPYKAQINESSQAAAEGGRLVSQVSYITKHHWLAVRQEDLGYNLVWICVKVKCCEVKSRSLSCNGYGCTCGNGFGELR